MSSGAAHIWLQPLLHVVAGLNLSGLSSGTVHRAVGVSSAGRVHDASWDTESLFLTLQVILTTAIYLPWPLSPHALT